MIFGSEGLPRSGKSLEAMQHIIDSLARGRTVVTNIHGIDKKAMSEYLVLPLPTVERLLITLVHPFEDHEEDKVVPWVKDEFLKYAVTDSLWIWDEVNQFWPPDRQPLSPQWAKFVTEHGHFGIDILIMGQDLTELHTTWRKRLQRYTRYTKLDMMGKEDSFHWASYSNSGRNKFKRTAEGTKPYNKKFFPLYQSHRAETQNKANYKDKRYGVFQTKHKVYALIFAALLLYAMYYIWGFFHHAPVVTPAAESSVPASLPPVASGAPGAVAKTAPVVAEPKPDAQPSKPAPIDYLDKLASKYDLRLAGLLERSPQAGDTRPWLEFQIDVVDASYHIKERFNRASIAALGWDIKRTDYGLELSKQGVVYVVRPWPLDNWGKVSRQAITDIKPARETSQLAEPLSGQSGGSVSSRLTSGAGFTVVADTSRGGNSVLK